MNDTEEPDWSKIEKQIDDGILINDDNTVQGRDGKQNFRKGKVDLKPNKQHY